MRVYDVTVPLSPTTPVYPGDPGIQIKEWSSLAKGDAANVSVLQFGSHSGTHVDAPAHFIEGAPGLDSLAVDVFMGEAQVVEVPDSVLVIDASFLTCNVRPETPRILFKTRNSRFWANKEPFRPDYTYIDQTAATKIVEWQIRLVGVDYLSIEAFKARHFETHQILLSESIVIVEGLDLTRVPAGTYELICLPLKISGGLGDGAPARAVLRTRE